MLTLISLYFFFYTIPDSDDDLIREDVTTCSPIHKCYGNYTYKQIIHHFNRILKYLIVQCVNVQLFLLPGASKTPPCILRRNAKLAEKNLKDIVELTKREKIYTPSVVSKHN